jgi:hypothetical protein
MDWLGLLGIAIPTIVAIILGVPPLRAALKDLHKAPKLTVSFNGANERSIVYAADLGEHEAVMAEYHIAISNSGTESARDVLVRVDVPSFIYATEGVQREANAIAKIMRYEQAAEDIRDTKRTLLIYRLPIVQQKTSHNLVDTFTFFLDSSTRRKVDAVTKDNVAVEVEYALRHSYRVRIEVLAENHAPLIVEHEVQFYRTDSRELVNAFSKQAFSLLPRDADGAFAVGEPARIFVLKRNKLLFNDARVKVWYSKLVGAQVQLATYYDRVGYLPIRSNIDWELKEPNGGVYVESLGTAFEMKIDSIRRIYPPDGVMKDG